MLVKEEVIGDVPVTLSHITRTLAYFLMITPLMLCLYLLYSAHTLFRRYRQGEIFTPQSCQNLARIGWITVLLAPIYTFNETMFSLVVTMFNQPDQRVLAVQVDETDILAISIGLLLVIVSHIMRQAVTISDENNSFV